jgi:hypothetical protein
MKYRVVVPIWANIELEIDADNKEDALEKGIKEAIDKHPMVSWELDEYRIDCDEDLKWLVTEI